MKAATESVRASSILDPRQNLKRIRDAKAAVSTQLNDLHQAIQEHEERLVRAEADEIYRDSADDERSATVRTTLIDRREQLRTLDAKNKALDLAEKQAEQAVRAA